MAKSAFVTVVKAISRFYDWLCPIHTHCKDCGCEFKPPQRFQSCTRCHWT